MARTRLVQSPCAPFWPRPRSSELQESQCDIGQGPQRRQLLFARRLRGEGIEWNRVLENRLQYLDGVLPQLRIPAFQGAQ